jgi:hypothetical protein
MFLDISNLEQKKIAVCLSGIPKFWNKSYESIKQWLPTADIFIHTWKINDNSEVNENTCYSPNAYNNIAATDYNLVHAYNPKKYIIQDFVLKKKFFENQCEKYFSNFENPPAGNKNSISQLSMFYSLREACRLKASHERENSFTYDIVVRMRFDSEIKTFLDLNTLDYKNTLYIPNGRDWGGINDQFCFGNSSIIDMVCECYTFYDIHITVTNFYGPEVILKQHLATFLTQYNIIRPNINIEINNC